MAEIGAPHALRGMVHVRPYQALAPSIAPDREVFLERAGQWHRARVLDVVRGGGRMLLRLDGVADRTAAEGLRGVRVLVRADELPPAEPDEFYHHEIVGFTVATVAGDPLGTVTGTLVTGLNDVWVVEGNGREYLIPIVADVVRELDHAARHITIEPMPGLLD